MNQEQKRMVVGAAAAVAVLLTLTLVVRYLLRESSPPAVAQSAQTEDPERQPRRPVPASEFADEQEPETETMSQAENLRTTNAATLYQQAFALYDALSKDEKGLLVDWRTNVDASVEAELCEKVRPICDLMHQATAVTNCDWGIEPLTFDTKLPHLSPARAIARAAIWNAAHCRENDVTGASEDVLSTLRLGKIVSSSALIGSLVDMAIQGTAESYVAANIGLFRGSESQQLSVLLTDPAYEKVPSQALEQEASIHERLIAKLASLPADQFEKQMSEVDEAFGESSPKMDRAAVLASLQQIVDSQRTLAKALASGSEDEYEAWQKSSAELQNSNPLAEMFFGSYDKYLDRADRAAVNRALIVAGLAVAQDGPSALQSQLDPSTGQPFVYTETSDGFELQSGYKTNGVPLKMQFK